VTVTALKKAFELARRHDNIDIIIDPLLASELFVVAKEFAGASRPQFYAQPSPQSPNRICVTAAESRDALAGIANVVLMKMTGRELLEALEPFLELMVVYETGGEYLSREQLDWLRDLRNVTGTP
jgi:hypothetical protein